MTPSTGGSRSCSWPGRGTPCGRRRGARSGPAGGRKPCSQAMLRSTTQRWRPRPEPWAVPRRDLRLDPLLADLSAVAVVVVAALGGQAIGTSARRPDAAAQRRRGVERRQQLRDVVAVAAGQGAGERDTGGGHEQVVLGARPAPVDRARPRVGAPLLAGTWLEPASAREKSICPAARRRASGRPCSVQLLPDAGPPLLVEAPPAGDARAAAQLGRQVPPGDATVQDEEGAAQRRAIGQALVPRLAQAPRMRGQQRLDQFPELVGQDPWRRGHRRPSSLDGRSSRRFAVMIGQPSLSNEFLEQMRARA
jgi:hypothetical protein